MSGNDTKWRVALGFGVGLASIFFVRYCTTKLTKGNSLENITPNTPQPDSTNSTSLSTKRSIEVMQAIREREQRDHAKFQNGMETSTLNRTECIDQVITVKKQLKGELSILQEVNEQTGKILLLEKRNEELQSALEEKNKTIETLSNEVGSILEKAKDKIKRLERHNQELKDELEKLKKNHGDQE